MKKKKIVALTTATVISANMLPTGLLQVFADETTSEQEVIKVTEVEVPEVDEEISTYATTVDRNLNVTVNGVESPLGTIDGLTSNTITLNSKFEKKTLVWNKISNDEDVKLEIKAKSGYVCNVKSNIKLLANITPEIKGISIADQENEKSFGTGYEVTVKHFGIYSPTLSQVGDVETNIDITYKRRKNAQDIKLETVNVGDEGLVLPENLYFDENNNAAIDNGSTHTFTINPSENQEAYVTLNGAPVAVENNQFTVGAGELKVEFKEKVEKYNLDVEINGLGSILIGGKNISESQSIELNQNEDIVFTVKSGEGTYVSSVKLNEVELELNENGVYSAPYSDLENQKLEVTFAEKIETKVVFDSLRVPWNGQEQPLHYTIVGSDGQEVHNGTVKFERKILGIPYEVKPKDIDKYDFKVNFSENDKYKACEYSGTYEIYDNRQPVTIEFGELTKVYNGEVQKIEANVVNETGEIVGTADVTYKRKIDINDPFASLSTPGKDVGTHEFTATFKGNYDYKKTEVNGTLEITKCKPKIKVQNVTTSYTGNPIRTNVVVTPDCGYMNLYSGVDLKLSPMVYMDVNLGNDGLGKLISDAINKAEIGNIGDLKKLFESEVLTKLLEAAGIDVTDIKKALQYLPDDIKVSFGAPTEAGAYVSTAIVLDKNAEVAVGVGSLIVTKANKEIIFTADSLASGSKIKAGLNYKHEAIFKGTDQKVEVKYTGLTNKGKSYSSTEAPQVPGVYVATASFKGDKNYRPTIVAREFAITKSSSKIIIVSSSLKKYDGKDYELRAVVKDEQGNYIENAKLDITYIKGFKTSKTAKDIGTYFVTVKYDGDESNVGTITYMNLKISK